MHRNSNSTLKLLLYSPHYHRLTVSGACACQDGPRIKYGSLPFQGHIETIFDCHLKPDNLDLLATASFDGTIKVWDVNTLKAVSACPFQPLCYKSCSWEKTPNNPFIQAISWGTVIWKLQPCCGCFVRLTPHQAMRVWFMPCPGPQPIWTT